jgi:uncharacterized membrane protein
MNSRSKGRREANLRLIVILIGIAGAAMIAFAVLTPQSNSGGMMGHGTTTYDLSNLVLAMAGAVLLTASLSFVFLREGYEPLEEDTVPMPPPASVSVPASVPMAASVVAPVEVADPPAAVPQAAAPDEKHLALRLLSGDERTVFRAILDAGGEIFQKDVVNRTKMSDAKVSRVLDRLEEKGLVTRERHGMSNKVRIEIEP